MAHDTAQAVAQPRSRPSSALHSRALTRGIHHSRPRRATVSRPVLRRDSAAERRSTSVDVAWRVERVAGEPIPDGATERVAQEQVHERRCVEHYLSHVVSRGRSRAASRAASLSYARRAPVTTRALDNQASVVRRGQVPPDRGLQRRRARPAARTAAASSIREVECSPRRHTTQATHGGSPRPETEAERRSGRSGCVGSGGKASRVAHARLVGRALSPTPDQQDDAAASHHIRKSRKPTAPAMPGTPASTSSAKTPATATSSISAVTAPMPAEPRGEHPRRRMAPVAPTNIATMAGTPVGADPVARAVPAAAAPTDRRSAPPSPAPGTAPRSRYGRGEDGSPARANSAGEEAARALPTPEAAPEPGQEHQEQHVAEEVQGRARTRDRPRRRSPPRPCIGRGLRGRASAGVKNVTMNRTMKIRPARPAMRSQFRVPATRVSPVPPAAAGPTRPGSLLERPPTTPLPARASAVVPAS